MSQKHVVFIVNSLSQGGAERVISILLNHFSLDNGFKVELVLLEDEIAYTIPQNVKVTLLSTLTNQDSAIKKTAYIPLLAYRLYKYVKEINPDLLVSFIYRADFVNVLASFLHKKPTIVSARVNASSTYNNNALSAKINKFLIKKFYPKATKVISVSEGTKEDLIKNFGVDDNKQVVIYNPYEKEKILGYAKEPLDISFHRDKTIVALSRFRPIKNIQLMLRAFSALESEATLVLVGDGSDEENLRSLVKTLGIQKRTLFVGGQDNPYKFLSNASIYISSSLSEGFPNALVEAMICGCAIISSDCPSGPREILAPNSHPTAYLSEGLEYAQYGVLTAMNDEKALTEALRTLLNEENKRKEYSQQACLRSDDFLVSEIYNKYVSTFVAVIEGEDK